MLTRVLFYLIVLPLSYVPMEGLYRLSDILYWVVYRFGAYRKTVVIENLRKSFPEKSYAEILLIASHFYRHFCDLIVESIKGFSISKNEILERVRVSNPEILEKYFKQGRSVIIAGGHYNNWEWMAMAIAPQIGHLPVGIYTRLSNVFFEEKMKASRERFGLKMLEKKDVPAFFREENEHPTRPKTATFFGIDQSPGDPRKAHWLKFLNQDTGVQFGAEKYAKDYNQPVLFGVIRKTTRGMYTFEVHEVSPDPKSEGPGAIIEKITALIEAEIRQDPRYWLWTHRRWKHRKPLDMKPELGPKA